MALVYVPYRWLPRTIWPNVSYGWWYFWNGVRNLFRYAPVVWHQQYSSSADLLLLLERRLRLQAERHGGHVGDEKQKRDMLICAELCRRLADDWDYMLPDDPPWRRASYFEGLRYHKITWLGRKRDDARLLGKILGARVSTWWC
jgi:hypothetical protein